MILAPSDARIIYPPANMPPNVPINTFVTDEDAKKERRIKAAKKKDGSYSIQKKVKGEE